MKPKTKKEVDLFLQLCKKVDAMSDAVALIHGKVFSDTGTPLPPQPDITSQSPAHTYNCHVESFPMIPEADKTMKELANMVDVFCRRKGIARAKVEYQKVT